MLVCLPTLNSSNHFFFFFFSSTIFVLFYLFAYATTVSRLFFHSHLLHHLHPSAFHLKSQQIQKQNGRFNDPRYMIIMTIALSLRTFLFLFLLCQSILQVLLCNEMPDFSLLSRSLSFSCETIYFSPIFIFIYYSLVICLSR